MKNKTDNEKDLIMAKGGFKVINHGKTQYCHRITTDYDEAEFSLNGGKSQIMDRNDFKVEIDNNDS